MNDETLEDMGVALSQMCKWDGYDIIKVSFAALTDANFHTLRSRLEDAFNAYTEEIE